MKYSVIFILLGVCFAIDAIMWGGLWLLLLWPSSSFILAGLAYGWFGPGFFGKRNDGSMAWWAVLLNFPYLLSTWTTWHIQRRLSREPRISEIVPGLWIGRRPLRGDLPHGVQLVVDLTAEFPSHGRDRENCRYLCVPTLDAQAGRGGDLLRLAQQLVDSNEPTLIHCAQGHGRSGMLAAIVLIGKGLAPSADEAVRMIRAVRPEVRLNASQLSVVQAVSLKAPASIQKPHPS